LITAIVLLKADVHSIPETGQAIAELPEAELHRGLAHLQNGHVSTITHADGLGSDLIGALTLRHNGDLAIATSGGLTLLHNGRFRNFTTRDGLSSNIIMARLTFERRCVLFVHVDIHVTLFLFCNAFRMHATRIGLFVPIHRAVDAVFVALCNTDTVGTSVPIGRMRI